MRKLGLTLVTVVLVVISTAMTAQDFHPNTACGPETQARVSPLPTVPLPDDLVIAQKAIEQEVIAQTFTLILDSAVRDSLMRSLASGQKQDGRGSLVAVTLETEAARKALVALLLALGERP